MIKDKKINIHHLLIPIAVTAIICSLLMFNQTLVQIELILLVSATYLTLSVVHHHFDKSLTIETMLEYILIAMLVIVIFGGFTLL